jgi:hypothetical protein
MLPASYGLIGAALDSYSGCSNKVWATGYPVFIQSLQVNTRSVTSVRPHPPLFQIRINAIKPTTDKASLNVEESTTTSQICALVTKKEARFTVQRTGERFAVFTAETA